MDGWDQQPARNIAVDADTCVFCKLPKDQWDDDVDAVDLSTGEIVCSQCLRDLREYNRYRKFLIVVSDGYAPAARTIIHEGFEEMARDLADVYDDDDQLPWLETMYSDANHSDG